MESDEIRQRIKDLRASDSAADAVAETYHQRWESDSKPVLVTASDGNDYVVKGIHKKALGLQDAERFWYQWESCADEQDLYYCDREGPYRLDI